MISGRRVVLLLLATFAACHTGTATGICSSGDECAAASETKDHVLLQSKGALKSIDSGADQKVEDNEEDAALKEVAEEENSKGAAEGESHDEANEANEEDAETAGRLLLSKRTVQDDEEKVLALDMAHWGFGLPNLNPFPPITKLIGKGTAEVGKLAVQCVETGYYKIRIDTIQKSIEREEKVHEDIKAKVDKFEKEVEDDAEACACGETASRWCDPAKISEEEGKLEKELRDSEARDRKLQEDIEKFKDKCSHNNCCKAVNWVADRWEAIKEIIENIVLILKQVVCWAIAMALDACGVLIDKQVAILFPNLAAQQALCAAKPKAPSTSQVEALRSGRSLSLEEHGANETYTAGEVTSFQDQVEGVGLYESAWSLFLFIAERSGVKKLEDFAKDGEVALVSFIVFRLVDALCGQVGTMIMAIVKELVFCNLPELDCQIPVAQCNVEHFNFRKSSLLSLAEATGQWYCAIRHSGGNIVLKKAYDLSEARYALGTGSSSKQQAIIPMSGSQVTAGGTTSLGGDPHTLSKTWSGGSMWWSGWSAINSMRKKCATEDPPGPSASTNHGGKYLIKSGFDNKCLIFSGGGGEKHPERYDWGNGGNYCGIGDKAAVISNKQAVWKIEHLEGDKYLIKSGVDNKCLIFSGGGGDKHPSRHDWGNGGDYCGIGDKAAVISNKQAVWNIQFLDAGKYMIKSDVDNKCLIFSGRGGEKNPERYDWGHGGNYCGIGDKAAVISNKQAVFILQSLEAGCICATSGCCPAGNPYHKPTTCGECVCAT